MSLEGLIKNLSDLLTTAGRASIRTLDMDPIWKSIFQSNKQADEMEKVSTLIKEIFMLNPDLRNKKYKTLDAIVNNFSDPQIQVDQRYEASYSIFKLLPYYSDENIVKVCLSMVEILSAFTDNRKNIPYDIINDFALYDNLNEEVSRKVIEEFRMIVGKTYENPMILVMMTIFPSLSQVDECYGLVYESLNSLLNGKALSVSIACHLAQHLCENSKCDMISEDLFQKFISLMNVDDDEISHIAYDSVIRSMMTKEFYLNEFYMKVFIENRTKIATKNLNRIYSVLSWYTKPDENEELQVDLIFNLAKMLHEIIISPDISDYELGYAFCCQASVIDAVEESIKEFYKQELKIARNFVARKLFHTYPGISAFVCSISSLVGPRGAEKISEIVPEILKSLETDNLDIDEKLIIAKSLSIMVGSGDQHILREPITKSADYLMNDSDKRLSICGADMIVHLDVMVAVTCLSEVSASIIGIIETDKDVDVVVAMFKALKALIRNFEFESSAFSNIIEMISTNTLPCSPIIVTVENTFPIFHFLEIFIEKYPGDCLNLAKTLAQWMPDASNKQLKNIVRPLVSCFRHEIVPRRLAERCQEKFCEVLNDLDVSYIKVHQAVLEILYLMVKETTDGVDLQSLYNAVERVVAIYDHPRKGEDLGPGLSYAACIVMILYNVKNVNVNENVLINLVTLEMPFKPVLDLCDDGLRYLLQVLKKPSSFGRERTKAFKIISDILMLPDVTSREHGYRDDTIKKAHKALVDECKSNSDVANGLQQKYEKKTITTISFEELIK